MNLNKNKLRKIIKESMVNNQISKLKSMLSSYDRASIIQAYELCETLDLGPFDWIVRQLVSEELNSTSILNDIHTYVNNLTAVFHHHNNNFYVENENLETDIQMEFAFKTIGDIQKNIEDYYVALFTAIGQGK